MSASNGKKSTTKKETRRFPMIVLMAGMERIELSHAGVRIQSLTAWLHPNDCDCITNFI